ncbi:MAG: hypothetical protein Q8P57_02670 [Candidatus Pacearchaeota archaeon]|nr:hypothetical protein [Candidatus Pacearchaeota archaeon]
MEMLSLLLANTALFVIILVVMLVVLAIKPRNRKPKTRINPRQDLHAIKKQINGED